MKMIRRRLSHRSKSKRNKIKRLRDRAKRSIRKFMRTNYGDLDRWFPKSKPYDDFLMVHVVILAFMALGSYGYVLGSDSPHKFIPGFILCLISFLSGLFGFSFYNFCIVIKACIMNKD